MNKNGKRVLVFSLLLFGMLAISIVVAGGKPQCKDGIDNDGDGLTDYPFDPGCDSKNDRDESNEIAVCGNDIIEGSEVCDGSDLGDEDCMSQGFDGGSLECEDDCSGFVTSGCFENTCSDTDGGFIWTTQGEVSGYFEGNSYKYIDYCIGNNTNSVMEYSCWEDKWYSNSVDCEGNQTTTCSEGACI